YAAIRCGSLMEQDQASQSLTRSPQSKPMRAGQKQYRSLPCIPRLSNRLRHSQNRWIRLLLRPTSLRPVARLSEASSNPPNRPHARFLGWFPLLSRVFWTVALHSWNAPTVQARAPSNRVVASCGSSLMTSAKHVPQRLPDGGHGWMRSGISSVVKDFPEVIGYQAALLK